MRALVFDKKLKFRRDYPVPEPGPEEALIRVLMAGICDTDLEIIKGYMDYQGILGHEFVGKVEKVMDPSAESMTGKRVVGEINCGCGSCSLCLQNLERHCPRRSVMGIQNRNGCFSDYIVLPVRNLLEVPAGLSDEEAVFCEPLAAAMEIIEQSHIKPTENILVLGDGKLGILTALVLSRTAKVTLAGRHPEKMEKVREKYIQTSLSRNIRGPFDVVVEAAGSHQGREQALTLVRPRGRVILKSTVAEQKPWNVNSAVINEITLIGSRCGPFEPALRAMEHGLDVRPLISGVYPLEEAETAVKEAGEKESLKILLDMRSG